MKKTIYQVVVSGSVLYETNDQLIADAQAHNYRGIGWTNVKVVPMKKKKEQSLFDRENEWPVESFEL